MTSTWPAEGPADICKALQTSEAGLSVGEADRRLRAGGPNILPEAKTVGPAVMFLRQFQSPLIYLLFAAAVAVYFLGEVADSAIIIVLLIFNAIVGTIQEGRAQNTLGALKRYVETTAVVVRGGEEAAVPDAGVVRGDVIILREGERVPADARLVAIHNLTLDEASLTGESEPVAKTAETLSQVIHAGTAQKNMVYKGTTVTTGSGRAIVVATGAQTVIGSIAQTITTIDAEIPLKASIRRLSRVLITAVGVIGVVLLLLGLARGETAVSIFSTVVSLAVSVIPEGLPVVMTLVLATGMWRMSKRHVLVKNLDAVESLGQARVIAVDKTGTITKNELTVCDVWTDGKRFTIGGVGYEPSGSVTLDESVVDAANHPELLLAGKVAALCAGARVFFSEAEQRWHVAGDPTEAALQVFAEKIGFKKDDLMHETPIVSEMSFDFRSKYHAVVAGNQQDRFLAVAGAPEPILALATHWYRDGSIRPLEREDREECERAIADMSKRGLRVVAAAVREGFSGSLETETIRGLSLVGFFGMQDVLRPEVAGAMARAAEAGVRVVMITGDHTLTARAIAQEAEIYHEGDDVLTGVEIDAMTDAELAVRVARASVFARVTPEHKLRIIRAYEQRGEIVAMTGDGVNDAPSLVAANLGVAMGKIGTEVAKEAADIVLLDDDFGSIISAIEEGRNIYLTIKKVILYLFSTSLGEALTITVALVIGYPLPILAVQILWLNFVTDGFLDVALAMEPKEPGLLSRAFAKPHPYLVDWPMARRMVVMALPMVVGTLFLFERYAVADLAKAWTVSLTALAVFQWFNAWNCRAERESLFATNPLSNTYLLAATGTIIILQLLAVYAPPLERILHTVPLSLFEWVLIVAVASSIVWIEELRKLVARSRAARRARYTPARRIAP